MLLDHFNSFADFQPVDFALDFPVALPAPRTGTPARSHRGGFLPATLVETGRGFIQARDVKPGDTVYTYDGGGQEVKSVRHRVPRMTTLMHVPAGALGNDTDLMLPSDQKVALELETAERLFGVPVVVVKLIALAGYNGITAAAPERLGRIHFEFEEEELVWAECGMLMLAGNGGPDGAFQELSVAETRQVLASEDGRALAHAGIEGEDARVVTPLDDILAPLLAA
ncbi:Hint domain-containing protein [Roseobacteraceae bacterium NS-SX3]